MNRYLIELDVKRRKFSRIFSCTILAFLLFLNIIFLILRYYFPKHSILVSNEILLLTFLSTGYVALLLAIIDYAFIFTYRIITFTLFCLIVFVSFKFCHISSIVFLLYIPLAIMIYIITTLKKAIISSILIIIICLVTPFFAEKINAQWTIAVQLKDLILIKILEIYVVVCASTVSLITFPYLLEFIKIETKHNLYKTINNGRHLENLIEEVNTKDKSVDNYKVISVDNNAAEELKKFKKIYDDIIAIYEKDKPYQSPDFTIKKLALTVNTNETYVSIALNKIGNYNFSTLTNKYRIDQVLEEFKMNNHHKYTVIFIYSRAGFNHQSTFNRIFKKHTGSSPTAYIKKLNRNSNI